MKFHYAVKFVPENGRQDSRTWRTKLTLKEAREEAERIVRNRTAKRATIVKWGEMEVYEREEQPIKVTKL